MKILLVSTGGTISSVITDKGINVSDKKALPLIRAYNEKFPGNDVDFDVVSVVNILSENINKSVWQKLYSFLLATDYSKYDGVIITHGSDTLAYTSALVGLALSDIQKPVAVVAANRPIEDETSNGLYNLDCAVNIIKNKMNGVFVPYRNSDGVMYVHQACELYESQVISDDFYSVDTAYAIYENGAFIIKNKDYKSKRMMTGVFEGENITLSGEVMMITQYPEINFDRYDVSGLSVVILRLYHSATACTDGEYNKTVQSLYDKCKKSGVELYLCSAKKGNRVYDSFNKLTACDVKVLYDIAPACAYMKLLFATSQNKVSVKEFMDY